VASSKNTREIVTSIVLILIGVGVGSIINDIPGITFNTEIDLATCIAILGLVATIFIMPFVVERKLNQQDNINKVVLIDIDSIYSDVLKLKQIYVELTPRTSISQKKYVEIIALFKTISSGILALNTELEKRQKLENFKNDVYDNSYTPTKESCTETLVIKKKLDEKTILDANESLNGLCSSLRTYRYEAYS